MWGSVLPHLVHDCHTCDIVIYNNKYLFDIHHGSWHRNPKTLGISSASSDKDVFCCANEVTYWKVPKHEGWLSIEPTL